MKYLIILLFNFYVLSPTITAVEIGFSLQDFTESFSQCIITLNHFDIQYHTPGLKVPVIINFSLLAFKLNSRIHQRKYCFCVLNEILYPENASEEIDSKLINLVLYATAPVYSTHSRWISGYENYFNRSAKSYPFAPLNMLEYHYFFLITKKEPRYWVTALISAISLRLSSIHFKINNKTFNFSCC